MGPTVTGSELGPLALLLLDNRLYFIRFFIFHIGVILSNIILILKARTIEVWRCYKGIWTFWFLLFPSNTLIFCYYLAITFKYLSKQSSGETIRQLLSPFGHMETNKIPFDIWVTWSGMQFIVVKFCTRRKRSKWVKRIHVAENAEQIKLFC